jgi:hypothetical protein
MRRLEESGLQLLSTALSGECFGQEFDVDVGPTLVDVWIDPQTVLPTKSLMTGEVTTNQKRVTYESELEYSNFNGSYPIPTAPPDAKDLPDFGFGDCFDGA